MTEPATGVGEPAALATAEAIARLEERMLSLPPRKRKLVELKLAEMRRAAGSAAADPGLVRRFQERSPLSFSQERLWLIDQIEPGSAAYNITSGHRFLGPLQPRALARSWAEVIRRHEVLRSVFTVEEGVPVQQVNPAPGPTGLLPVIDLGGIAGERQAELETRLARSLAFRPFDLARGPLLRVGALRTGGEAHTVVFVVHHAVADGWSTGLMVQELLVLYLAYRAGRPSPLPALPIQYGDFASWQREAFGDEALAEQLAYWKQRLADAPRELELPTDHPYPATRSDRGDMVRVVLSREVVGRLRLLAREENTTLFTVILALYQLLLANWSRQVDLTVGSPIAGRNRLETDSLVGFFVNTLVYRGDLSGNPTFRQLVGRLRKVVLEAQAHDQVPFERLVSELQPERSLNRTPIFQALLAFHNLPPTRGGDALAAAGGLRIEPFALGRVTAKFDVLLELFDLSAAGDEGDLKGELEYSTDLFEPVTAGRMARAFETLAAGVAADADRLLSRLPLWGGEPLRAQVAAWRPEPSRWDGTPVSDQVARLAARIPEAEAVRCAGAALTYFELVARADRLAHRLVALGVGPETAVAIGMERGLDLVVAVQAVLRAGGVLGPLELAHPDDRLRFQIEDLGARWILVDSVNERRLEALSAGLSVTLLHLNENADENADVAGEAPASRDATSPVTVLPAVAPANLFYVVYTSGSTGKPKGVCLAHAPLGNLIEWHTRVCARGGRSLGYAALAFDAFYREMYTALTSGGTLILATDEERRDIDALAELLSRERVEQAQFPVVVLQALAERYPSRTELPLVLSEIGTTGEQAQMSPTVVALFESLRAASRDFENHEVRPESEPVFRNQYGPSETHVVTALELRGAATGWPALPPIGRPIAQSPCWVVDRWDRLAPPGVPGELLLGGIGLARGYLNRPGLTAARFIPAPAEVASEAGERLYRSGDLARVRFDGVLEYLGRIDHQVKLRGFRIELGEVETTLMTLPGVARAAAMVREDRPGDRRLVAYVVGREGGDALDLTALRRAVAARLPDAMVPSALVELEELPLSSNQKVDRRRLPAPGRDRRTAGAEFIAPRTAMEARVAALFGEVLGVDRVGVDDGFFELGGHSLLATQLVARLRARLGLTLPLRLLFAGPTVAAVAARLSGEELEAGEPSPLPPRARPAGEPVPASFAQERLWFLDQLESGTAFYNLALVLHLEGRLDVRLLHRAVQRTVDRHESLRTRFESQDGKPVQVVAARRSHRLPLIDLTGLTARARDASARRLASAEVTRPFDLAAGPLMRTTLLRLAAAEHVIAVDLHHVVTDGWSQLVLWRDVVGDYERLLAAHRAGEGEPPIGRPALQYPDFAAWQREWLEAGELERQLDYWRRELTGVPSLELPTDRPRPAVQTFRGALLPVAVDVTLSEAVEALAAAEGSTLFMVLLTAFTALHARYSGQRDFAVGSPIANRNRLELEEMIGFFANTLALRSRFDGEPSGRELLRRVRETTFGAYAHQDLPFEKLVDEVQPRRDLSRNPIFQVMLVLQNQPGGESLSVEGLRVEPWGIDPGTAKFDLTLFVSRVEDGLRGLIEYNTDLFDAVTIQRMDRHLLALLAGMIASPDLPLSRLELVSASERHQLIHEWRVAGAVPVAGKRGERVTDRVARQARTTPDAVAVRCAGGALTFAELLARADRLARGLRARGVGLDVPVAIAVERGLTAAVAVLAVLRAGGACAPLDLSHPDERLRFQLEDVAAPLVLVDGSTEARLREIAGSLPTVTLRADAEALPSTPLGDAPSGDRLPGDELPGESPAPAAENLFYVIYTSGSTGRPKGVALPHSALANLLDWHTAWCARGVRSLGYAALAFDVCYLEMFAAWSSGGTLVLATEEERRDVASLAGLLTRERVEQALLPVVVLQALAELFPAGRALPLALAEVSTAGEQAHLTPAVVSWFERLGEGAKAAGSEPPVYLNQYGPSETHVVTALTLRGSPARWPGRPSIGRAIPNAPCWVFDRWSRLAPRGVPGELRLGGVSLARGYLRRPGVTAERFVPAPAEVAAGPGERLYRSGDLARVRSDGLIEYLGRIDHQVKLRGFRIELGEVEAALTASPAVAAAAAMVREDRPGDHRLVAYVVATGRNEPLDVAALRRSLTERLPQPMVPSAIVRLDELPLSSNQKVDRRLLPAPDRDARGGGQPFVPPRTPVEEALAGIWAPLLGVERVGRDDDFFALGGHSLLATQAVSRIERAFGIKIPLLSFFQAPTVAELAALVARREGSEPPPPILARSREADGETDLPLSFAQERLWFLDQLEPGSALYNMALAIRLRGRLDVGSMAATIARVRRRHEALRTTFHLAGDGPVQRVAPASSVVSRLPCADLRGLAVARAEPLARSLAAIEATRPFDLARGPLLRASFLRLAEDEQVLLLSNHHVVSDGWSLGVLVDEVAALYAARREGRPNPLAQLAVQYPDFALWQRAWLDAGELERQLDYWRRRLDGAPALLELPSDRPRPAARSGRGSGLRAKFSAAVQQRLAATAGARGATLFMGLLAGFSLVLSRASGQSDLVIGSPVAGRNRAELEPLIGFFVNTLALRIEVAEARSFADLIDLARDSALGAFTHQDVPFERLVEELAVERALDRSPVFQVMLTLQNTPMGAIELPGLELTPLAMETRVAKFDLGLSITETPDGLEVAAELNADLFDPTTIARLLDHLEAALEAGAAEPDRPLGELDLLRPAQRHQLIHEWNEVGDWRPWSVSPARDGGVDGGGERTIHGWVKHQARRTPGAPAVIEGDRTLTYGELDGAATRLTARLRRTGVARGMTVGILGSRSLELVVGLLAILKSGAAYVPLDPAHPVERLRWMALDSGVAALLVTAERWAALAEEVVVERPAAAAEPESATGTIPVSRIRLDGAGDATAEESGASALASPLQTPASLPEITPRDRAYVIYTSGSTGRPKGVSIPHRGVERLVRGAAGLTLGLDDRVAQMGNPAFDVSSLEIWGPLMNGAAVVVIPPEMVLEPERLEAALRRHRVTTTFHTPALFNEHVQHAPRLFDALRTVFLGGEAADPGAVRRVLERAAQRAGQRPRERPPLTVINAYGPTESTAIATWHRVTSVAVGAPSVPIGRAWSHTRALLFDRRWRLVPLGAAGELWLGGDGLAHGYLGRPAITAAAFVPDPFGDGQRLYRTGDLARWLPSGNLDFAGRIDHQVKIRGVRIELGEIEAALAGHPRVASAAARVVESPRIGKRLVAYVVPVPGPEGEPELREVLAEVLTEALAARLPEAMVPSLFVELAELPLNANGKVDRRRLPDPEPPAEGGHEAPATPAEEAVAAVWAAVLGREKVGATEDFFALGGHSLLATQAASRIRDAFGVELPLRRIFESPTPRALARWIEREGGFEAEGRQKEGRTRIVPRPPGAEGDLPLSFSQERLWFLDRLGQGVTALNIPFPVTLRGRLRPALLAAALREVARRHESLRTRFAEVGGRPVQRIEAEPVLALPAVDLSGLASGGPGRAAERDSSGAATATADRLRALASARPFDLTRTPLARAVLIRLAADEHLVAFCIHHIVSDGWSMGVLLRELGTLYEAFAAGRPSLLAPLPVQYADYALWQREQLDGGLAADQLDYWRGQLGGELPVLDLPLDRPRPPVQTFRGEWRSARLSPELTAALRALERRCGATTFMVLLAAFDLLMARLAGQEEVLVGTPIAGRGRSETEGLIGFFLNTLVLRTPLGDDPTFGSLVARVRETALDAYAHQDVPFERLLTALAPERDLSRTPFFQVFFNMVNLDGVNLDGVNLDGAGGSIAPVELSGLTLEPVAQPEAEAKFDLTVYARDEGAGLGLQWLFNADLFDGARIEEMLRQYLSILEHAVATPDVAISRLSLVTPEAALLLPETARTLDASWQGSVQALMREQARRRPEAPAVVDGETTWSYRDLARLSGWIGSRLATGGVARGDRVVIQGHRSAPLVAAVFGVLEAGAAFVILDPAYPPLRQAEIVEAARPTGWIALQAVQTSPARLPVELETALDALAAPPCRISLPLTSELAAAGAGPDPWQPVPVGPDDAAVVGFTSGSTGRPKGIVGRHGSLSHFLPFQRERFDLGEGDRYTMLSGLAHDPLQRDLFTPLATGGTLVIPDPLEIPLPGRMARWMAEHEVTVAHLTPAMGQLVAEMSAGAAGGLESASGPVTVESLRWIFLVGDVLTRRDVARLRRLAPRARVVNLFGSTETQRAVSYHVVAEPSAGDLAAVDGAASGAVKEVLPLGRGMRGAQLLVLDRHGRSAGVGEVGELCTRSPHLALGYLDDPRRTAERFAPDPSRGSVGGRIYRTGDLGRYLPDGDVSYVGRGDQQVKIRGFRIELGEIEAVLGGHPGIREAVVLAPADGPRGSRRLVAFVTLSLSGEGAPGQGAPASEELRAFLAARLPVNLVPSAFVVLSELPLTPNGKVDRRALPLPDVALRASSAAAPTTELEAKIAAVWREVLELPMVGIYDNFFDLGGHSLLLVRLHAGLQAALERELPLIDLFSHPTVHALASHLRQDGEGARASSEAELEGVGEVADRQRKALERRRARARKIKAAAD